MSNHVKGMTSCRPPEDDCISRQAAIDALRYAQHRFTVADEAGGIGTVKWSEDVIYFAAAERILTELPSAQPDLSGYSDRLWKAAYERGKAEAQRTGKWIDCDGGIATCSACGDRWGVYGVMKFCPNCGAKMEGENGN